MLACREGWDVWRVNANGAEIQRLDDPGSIRELAEIMPEPVFDCDSEAIEHVLRKAREGSELHITALATAHGVSYLETAMWLASGETGDLGCHC